MNAGTIKTLKSVIRLGTVTTFPPEVSVNPLLVEQLIVNFLNEDLGVVGDITSSALPSKRVEAVFIAKEECLLCGLPFARKVFSLYDPSVEFTPLLGEGELLKPGTVFARVEGPVSSILTCERTALNLLQRLSGIATNTRRFVEALKDSRVKLLDTRKTTPGLRLFEKYATRVGGALNHRFGLYDAVMVKDNHIAACGGVEEAVRRVCAVKPATAKVEVEVQNWNELRQLLPVLDLVDIVMLDNWPLEEVPEAVELLRKRSSVKIELSGGITLDTLKRVAALPVDYVSTSKLITAATWVDLSVEVCGDGTAYDERS